MRSLFTIAIACLLFISCNRHEPLSSQDSVNWEKRAVKTVPADSLESGSTFISVYAQIYVRSLNDQTGLTSTISIHNPNIKDQIYIDKAVCYNTHGEAIRTYFDQPVYVNPMETLQIVIDGLDNEGGTGANFVFDWRIKSTLNEPIMEAIMITTSSNQGISFVTNGKKIK